VRLFSEFNKDATLIYPLSLYSYIIAEEHGASLLYPKYRRCA